MFRVHAFTLVGCSDNCSSEWFMRWMDLPMAPTTGLKLAVPGQPDIVCGTVRYDPMTNICYVEDARIGVDMEIQTMQETIDYMAARGWKHVERVEARRMLGK